jgi:hypothetical protein
MAADQKKPDQDNSESPRIDYGAFIANALSSHAKHIHAKRHFINIDPKYRGQVELLLKVLPHVAKEKYFALKGGTAINLFDRDFPRLSVDIDLTYVPFDDRKTAFANITAALRRIKKEIEDRVPDTKVVERLPTATSESDLKLICSNQAQIKIEVNPVIRGSLMPPRLMRVSKSIQDQFQMFAEMNIVSRGELYGGKICAAIDRQHPRDIYDVWDFHKYTASGAILQPSETEITEDIRLGFIAALMGHKRPAHELLNPRPKDQKETFEGSFQGMAFDLFSYKDFETTRDWLFEEVRKLFKDEDREFLVSFTEGDPKWDLFPIARLKDMPAVKWKLLKLREFKKKRPKDHAALVQELVKVFNQKSK